MMDERLFWRLVEESRAGSGGDRDEQIASLEAKLAKLAPEDIVEWKELFHDLEVRSYTWDLWAAAYVIQGGCGDDSFDYFRAWLISMGEKVYNQA